MFFTKNERTFADAGEKVINLSMMTGCLKMRLNLASIHGLFKRQLYIYICIYHSGS